MGRITEFKDLEYERQLAEFKAKKAQAKAEQAKSGSGEPVKKRVTEQTWVSVKKTQ